jgi:hypothetical protein
VLFAGRAAANARGAGHPALAGYPERFRSREQRLVEVLHNHVAPERFDDSATVGFWPGCDAIDKGLDDVDAALRLFDQAGATEVKMVSASQACAGYPLLAAGLIDMFRCRPRDGGRAQAVPDRGGQLLGMRVHAARAVPGRGRHARERGALSGRVPGPAGEAPRRGERRRVRASHGLLPRPVLPGPLHRRDRGAAPGALAPVRGARAARIAQRDRLLRRGGLR